MISMPMHFKAILILALILNACTGVEPKIGNLSLGNVRIVELISVDRLLDIDGTPVLTLKIQKGTSTEKISFTLRPRNISVLWRNRLLKVDVASPEAIAFSAKLKEASIGWTTARKRNAERLVRILRGEQKNSQAGWELIWF